MDYKLLINTAVLAGEIMLCSGAETYRVEDTIHHILKTSEAEIVETIVLMTGITASLGGSDIDTLTVVKRVNNRGTNLHRIESVNDISRRYCGNEITLEEAYDRLQNIKEKQYRRMVYNFATIGVVVGFVLMFGGGVADAVAAGIVGAALAVTMLAGEALGVNVFILDVIASIGIAFMAIVLKSIMPDSMNLDTVIISGIMPLVPGVAITNAVRDTLQGDYISGTARTLEAFLKAASIALGVGIGVTVFSGIFLGKGMF